MYTCVAMNIHIQLRAINIRLNMLVRPAELAEMAEMAASGQNPS